MPVHHLSVLADNYRAMRRNARLHAATCCHQGYTPPDCHFQKNWGWPSFRPKNTGRSPALLGQHSHFPGAAPTLALVQKKNLGCSSVECARVPLLLLGYPNPGSMHTTQINGAYNIDSHTPKYISWLQKKLGVAPGKRTKASGISPKFWRFLIILRGWPRISPRIPNSICRPRGDPPGVYNPVCQGRSYLQQNNTNNIWIQNKDKW
jgi:hypothetical protein